MNATRDRARVRERLASLHAMRDVMMLMQYAQALLLQGQSHTAPLVIPPSDTVFREQLSKAAGGLANTDWHLNIAVTVGLYTVNARPRLRCPLRTVLLTVVFTLDGARFLYLPEKQQEDFL